MMHEADPLYPVRRLARRVLLPAALLATVAGAARTQAPPPSREYQLKAVFLFNFAQFVEWPATAFAAADAPLVIGVLGENPFGTFLDATVAGERIGGHPLVVRQFQRVDDIASCHILFISGLEGERLAAVLERLRDRAILTVSDTDGFSRSGGMIRFVTDRNRIRLRINLEAATAAQLTLSSNLLRPATIVTTERP